MRPLTALCLTAVALPISSWSASADRFEGVQQDMVDQVAQARRNLQKGDLTMAMAHADLVLLDNPLKVSVVFDGVGTYRQPECQRAVEAALDLWNASLGGEKQFVRTSHPERADIRIHFQPQVYDHGDAVGGFVRWDRSIVYANNQPAAKTSADVQVRVLTPSGDYMSFEQMRHEASHELGHVLGLVDNKEYGDIMSPLVLQHPVGTISVGELEALKRLRRQAHEVKSEALLASTGV